MLPTQIPYQNYTDLDGKPLDEGSIYYGVANANPVTTPVPLFWDLAGTQPATQPIKTLNGYPVHFGTPANVYASTSSYSISVYDKKGRLVFYAPDSDEYNVFSIFAKDDGSTKIGYQLDAANSVERTVYSKLSDFISVKDFGAKGDGVTNDDAARIAAEAVSNSVYWPEGSYVLTSGPSLAKSWGPGKCYVGGNRVYLKPDSEPAVTVFAELMDVPTTAVTDCFAPLQRAIDFAQANKLSLTLPRRAQLKSSGQLVIKQGSGASTTFFNELDLIGNDAFLGSSTAGTAVLHVQPQCLVADKLTGRGQGLVRISRLTFTGFYEPASLAFKLGRDGYFGYDMNHSWMKDVNVSGYNHTQTFDIRAVGNWIFDNIAGEPGCGWSIGTYQNGDFTGDLIVQNCTITGNASVPSLNMSASAASGLAELRGLKFLNNNIYSAAINATAGNFGAIADMWFTNCGLSYEGAPLVVERRLFTGAVAASGQMYNIFFDRNYISGWYGTPIRFSGNVGAVMQNIKIENNEFGFCPVGTLSTPPAIVHFNGFNGGMVANNSFAANTVESLIYLQNARGMTITDNQSRDGTSKYGVTLIGTCENYVVMGNQAYLASGGPAIVNDGSTGVNKVVADNLLITVQ